MSDAVDQFHTLAMSLVEKAIEYASGGEYDEDTNAAIRRVTVLTNVLMQALNQAQMLVPRRPVGVP